MRIYLVGFMGSGKSYLAKKMTDSFNINLIDLDDYIEQKEKRSIRTIFEETGENYFRAVEKTCLHEITSQYDNIILATGGGTPCFHNNMDYMNRNGETIFINVDTDLLANRLSKEADKRPLLKKNRKNLIEFIQNKCDERKPYYNQSKYVFSIQSEGKFNEIKFKELLNDILNVTNK